MKYIVLLVSKIPRYRKFNFNINFFVIFVCDFHMLAMLSCIPCFFLPRKKGWLANYI